ncbi:MAG: twin-arginine translocation signal domain-containing protein, partial [Deltaproteobacteria bacterium]|nr:twin-arginine translocation signal domain-containing protein [Deltaproteobacteria bacterium]
MSKFSFTRRDFLKTAGTLAAGTALGANPEISFADNKDIRYRQIPSRNWQQTFQARLMDKEKGISPHPPARPRLECTSLEVIIDNVNNTRLLNMYVRNTGNWPTYSACIAVYQSKIIML